MISLNRVEHKLTRDDRDVGQVVSDLVYVDGQPYVLIGLDESFLGGPVGRVALDPQHLRRLDPAGPNAEYEYTLAVADPRRLG
jgi:hypothetical protein